jgi:hypothetical protein
MPALAGRPRAAETHERTQQFLRLLGEGAPPHLAARDAGIKADRVVRLLADRAFRQVVCALLDGQQEQAA